MLAPGALLASGYRLRRAQSAILTEIGCANEYLFGGGIELLPRVKAAGVS